jgi:hypothetical protein
VSAHNAPITAKDALLVAIAINARMALNSAGGNAFPLIRADIKIAITM